jgi:hypothetical protein
MRQEACHKPVVLTHIIIALLTDLECEVRPTARPAIHLLFDVSAHPLEIRALQNSKCTV